MREEAIIKCPRRVSLLLSAVNDDVARVDLLETSITCLLIEDLVSRLFYVAASCLNSSRLSPQLLKHCLPAVLRLPNLSDIEDELGQHRITGHCLRVFQTFDALLRAIDVHALIVRIHQASVY